VGDNVRFLGDSFKQLLALFDERLEALTPASGASAASRVDEVDLPYLREEIPKAVAQSLEGIERIGKIVGAMKEFSHPGQDRTLTDINRAIASTIMVATNEWKYLADIKTEFDATLPQVPVFPGEFNQVILNIIVNAAHAIGESAAANSSTKGTIRVVTSHTDHELEVSISDNGCGMPRQIQERIFDPFFTTKPVGKGTGQGLAIAHNVIVQKHGGSLTVSSEVGRGTTFVIRLPLEATSAAAAA
jgi:signal transduction histidine kinase